MRTTKVLVALVVSAAGCSSAGTGSSDALTAPLPLVVSPVAWNPANVDLGSVQTIAERDKAVLVFGSKGVQELTAGAVVSSDETITDWRSATAAPSADGLSTWMVGVDTRGHVLRIPQNGAPEDVSARYGVATDDVQSVVAATSHAVFLVDGGLAVSDGSHITRYRATARATAANGARVALVDGETVRLFDGDKQSAVVLPGVALVAFDGSGQLMAATAHALYEVYGTSVRAIYDAGSRTIHQLAAADASVWFTVDGDLGRWREGKVAVAAGGTLAPDAKLFGSGSGDAWVLSGGQLTRWTAEGGAPAGDEATWTSTVQPVHAAVCSKCHSPPGSGLDSSRVDLSTYAAWSSKKDSIYRRVVTQAGTPAQMPPPSAGSPITDAQRAAIEAWSK